MPETPVAATEARRLADLLSPESMERYRHELAVSEGRCLSCQGMRTRAVFVAGTGGGRAVVACPDCGGSGRLKDYERIMGIEVTPPGPLKRLLRRRA